MLRIALAAGLIVLAISQLTSVAAPDTTMTTTKSLAGRQLALQLACPAEVEIEPDPDLAGKIDIEARADAQEVLDGLRYSEGDTARIEHRGGCDGLDSELELTIRVPEGMPIEISGNSVVHYDIGETRGPLKMTTSGAIDLHAGRISALDLDSAGAVDVTIDRLDGPGTVALKGGGDFSIQAGVMPSLRLDSRGAGEIRVEGGRIGTLDLSLAGAGNAEIHAPVQDANLEIRGIGNIEIDKVAGKVDRKILGIGNIEIGS